MIFIYDLINIEEIISYETVRKNLKLKVALSNDIFGRDTVFIIVKKIVSDVAVDKNNFHYKLKDLDLKKLSDVIDDFSDSYLDKPNKIQHLGFKSVVNDSLSVRFNKDDPVLESFSMPDEVFNQKVSINNNNNNTINVLDIIFNNAPFYVDCYSPLTSIDFGKKIVESPVNINKLQAERLFELFSINSDDKTLIYMGNSNNMYCLNKEFDGFFKENEYNDLSDDQYNKLYNFIRYLDFHDAFIEIDRNFNITALIQNSSYSDNTYFRVPAKYINFELIDLI